MENVTNFTNFEEFVAAVPQVAGQSERALTCLGSGNQEGGNVGSFEPDSTVMLFKDFQVSYDILHDSSRRPPNG